MPRGSSPKREREYEELVGEFEKEGRYKGRQEEVAARIVNKQRAERGETKGARKSARRSRGGQSSSRKKPASSRRSGKKTSGRSAAKSSRGSSKRGQGGSSRSRRSSSGSRRARSSSSGRTARASSGSSATLTRDHELIRKWVESRGGHPSTVKGTGKGEPGILRIDFPGYSGQKTLKEISWEDFFEKFDEEKLAFLHQDKKNSRFSKLVRAR